MNIIYLCPSVNPLRGGIERVTHTLSNYLRSKDVNVYCVALPQEDNLNEEGLILLPDNSRDNAPKNKQFLNTFVKEYKIDIIVAQIGAPGDSSDLVAAIETPVKKIACLHLDIFDSVRHFGIANAHRLSKFGLRPVCKYIDNNLLTDFLVRLKKRKRGKSYKELCDNFDAVVLLSGRFIADYEYISGMKDIKNLVVIPNPLPTEEEIDEEDLLRSKDKTILYVGRIETGQKRVDHLLRIWQIVSKTHNDWRLEIVGDGPHLEQMKKLAKDLCLTNYSFKGYQAPEPYYRKGSILCLTSSFESFGMVIIEGMRYGVIPLAFNSYASVGDLINTNINGFIIKPFDIEEYANTISRLISDANLQKTMAHNAIAKSKEFSVNSIGAKWLALFNELMNQ